MLTFERVSKAYMGKKALSDINLIFETGKVYALAGPNGSGKSTLMKAAAGLVKPGAGTILLDGEKIGAGTKAKIAYMSTEPFYYDYMKISTVGAFYRDFFKDFDEARFRSLLAYLDLTPELKVKTLSSGMAAKLKVAATLSRRASVVMLDEPLNGIDVLGREQITNAILKTTEENRTLILSSHLLEDLEPLIDSVVLLKKGEVALTGDVESLRQTRGKSVVELYKETFAGASLDWEE